MNKAGAKSEQGGFWRWHKHFRHLIIGLAALALVLVVLVLFGKLINARYQAKLEPFYSTSGLELTGQLGEVVRQEPLGVEVEGGQGVRVLYRTQKADGSPSFSSGMVFWPSQAAESPRSVVAWAHGTLGMGEQCAPSRARNPANNLTWLSEILKNGWVVTATDYAGFGTPGVQGYLVGKAEAHDVLNSVRAARNLTDTGAGSEFAIWGHSQGGNSALFSAASAASYAPELNLVGTVASAPAAELVPLLDEQYGTVADWVIGPLVSVAWPANNAGLNADDVLTHAGKKTYQNIAKQCIGSSTLGGLLRNALRQKFFAVNPVGLPAWRQMAEAQSAPVLPPTQPLMVVESQTDKVVLPNTTALYIRNACQTGSNLASLWVDGVAHQDIPAKTAPDVIGWLSARFSGSSNATSCNQLLPVAPYQP